MVERTSVAAVVADLQTVVRERGYCISLLTIEDAKQLKGQWSDMVALIEEFKGEVADIKTDVEEELRRAGHG